MMQYPHGRPRPPWGAWAAALIAVGVLMSLGVWRGFQLSAIRTKGLHGGLGTPQQQLEWGLTTSDPTAVCDSLTRGADPNEPVTGTNAVPPLVEAIQPGSIEILAMLLDAGADPNAVSREGFSALYSSVVNGNASAAQLLLDRGADPNGGQHPHKGVTPLHRAAQKGDEQMVSVLLNAGADGRRRNDNGRTPADEARRHGHDAIAEMIEARAEGTAKTRRSE